MTRYCSRLSSRSCRNRSHSNSVSWQSKSIRKLVPFTRRQPTGLGVYMMARQQSFDRGQRGTGKGNRLKPVLFEGFVGCWYPPAHDVQDDIRIGPNLILSVRIGTKPQKVHKIVEVNLPVPLGVSVEG